MDSTGVDILLAEGTSMLVERSTFSGIDRKEGMWYLPVAASGDGEKSSYR